MLRQRQQVSERRFRQPAQARPVEVIYDVELAGQLRDRFQYLRPPPVMARIAADEHHIDGPVLACREGREFRIIGRKEIRGPASLLRDRRQDRRKIVDDKIVGGELDVHETARHARR